MGPHSKGDEVALLENGTVKVDKVAMKDLAFWLPYTQPHLCDGVSFTPTFDALVRLPVVQIGFILSSACVKNVLIYHHNHRQTLYMYIF